MNHKYYIVYKPYLVLTQFTATDGKQCLKNYFEVERNVYPVGRLDYDSEGLLILTNDTKLNHQLLSPVFNHEREYWVQVDGAITSEALDKLANGVVINVNGTRHTTKQAIVKRVDDVSSIPERNPPIRYRKNIPTSWISLTLTEGKNRQVRKMTASAGFPTLRLIRKRIRNIQLGDMQPGDIRELSRQLIYHQLFGK